MASEVIDAIRALDPNQPVIDVQTMQARIADTLLPRRLSAIVLQAFAVLALLLTVIGLYGTMMHGVTLARHGIAVRLALGAKRVDVRTLVLGRAALLTLSGLVIGLLGTILSTRLLGGLLYGVAPTDVATIATICAVMATVGFLAAWIPTRRAMAVDPIALLKSN
jgi:putative ABC transport system permease protein